MRQLIGLIVGLAALVLGFIFSGVIFATLLFLIVVLLTVMVLRRLWFKFTGRQPAPWFVFRHQRHQAAYYRGAEPNDSANGRTIDAVVEPESDQEKARIERD
jgi:UDP-N-acetylmuramyl pentapeptide phosphotransferase/UDP-N-acetylglucosamine-1-phosphate transferase